MSRTMHRCVVWTGDGRVFFYNPSSRISVWERPDELIGRVDVDKMMAGPPDAAAATNATPKSEARRSDGESDSSDEEERPSSKKIKLDEPKGSNDLLS